MLSVRASGNTGLGYSRRARVITLMSPSRRMRMKEPKRARYSRLDSMAVSEDLSCTEAMFF